MAGTIQLIDAAGNVSQLTTTQVDIIIEALDDAVVSRSLTINPVGMKEDAFYDSVVALKTLLLPFT